MISFSLFPSLHSILGHLTGFKATHTKTKSMASISSDALFAMRITDSGESQPLRLPPIIGWRQWPKASLRKALVPLFHLLSDDKLEAKILVAHARDHAEHVVAEGGDDEPLTRDEAGAIYVYTLVSFKRYWRLHDDQ
jgi:hypothetical protein